MSLIAEGQIDSLSLAEAGVENAVSVPTGAKGFTWVPHCWDFLKQFKTLIVFGDYEHEHMTLLDELSQRFDGTVKHVHAEDYTIDAQVTPSMEKWYRDKVYIYDNNILADKSEEDTLLETLEVAIRQYGSRVLVIDNLMTAMVDDTAVDQYRQQTIFVNALAKMAKQYNVVIFLIAHPRKKQGFVGFDNDDVAGSSNITNLVDVVLRYSRPKGKDILPDTMDRELTVFKNRLTGQTNRNGIKLFFQEGSKRIAESSFNFDWELGWEEHFEQMELGFMPVPDGVKLPFD